MTGPKTCFNKCILRPECHSYNYNRALLRCEINTQAKNYSVDDFKYVDGFDFVEIEKYRGNSFCDPCFDKPCKPGEICQKLSQGTNLCIKDYESSYCEDDWQYFGGYCYNFWKFQKSWHNAQEDCKGRNSNLIKIENDEENTWIVSSFLTAYTIDRIWIGASDILNEGHWVWVSDGSNLTFSPWNYNEPNNSGTGGEDCAVVKQTDMGWNDTPCGLINQYVCKKKSR
ncbi:Hypothetical predicted protein [Mytilus galloprovincialis]|nr:Hypothetical predicted protein [Mytilus galloprovincialis]